MLKNNKRKFVSNQGFLPSFGRCLSARIAIAQKTGQHENDNCVNTCQAVCQKSDNWSKIKNHLLYM